eukprot:SAG11_NODE_1331_length_5186_cov_3.907608_1_plen_227_part_10
MRRFARFATPVPLLGLLPQTSAEDEQQPAEAEEPKPKKGKGKKGQKDKGSEAEPVEVTQGGSAKRERERERERKLLRAASSLRSLLLCELQPEIPARRPRASASPLASSPSRLASPALPRQQNEDSDLDGSEADAQVKAMSKKQVAKELKNRGLSDKGKEPALRKRLTRAVKDEAQDADAPPEPDDGGGDGGDGIGLGTIVGGAVVGGAALGLASKMMGDDDGGGGG